MVLLNIEHLDHELALRGITARDLAKKAGIHEVVISRARHGGRVTQTTLRKVAKALDRIPILEGADVLVLKPSETRAPTKRDRQRSKTPAIKQESKRASARSS